MARKTGSKTANRKPAAHAAARKTTAAAKPLAAPKSKAPKKELKRDVAPATAAGKSREISPQESESRPAPAPGHEVESVSLIDRKKSRKKKEDAEPKTKRDVLPPISRIRASLEATVAPSTPAPPVEAAPAQTAPAEAPAEAAIPSAEAEAALQKVILIKPPIIVKQLATELGLRPHQLIAELMTYNIFANINQTI